MAKKGGVQQLQIEVNTDEELTKFLDKDGLIIMDVYTEWCGPCLAMVGSLKKIKLEKGGDDLLLAVVKCDHIETFKRFRNKCEPTWLFVSKKKIVNCAFGSNVPKLMSMITDELDIERKCRDGKAERVYYELTEMCSVELERFIVKKARDEEIEKIEREAAESKRRAYITFVTDEIMKHGGDMGVTVCMPHLITRDLFKRMTEQGDKFGLQAKDKKNALISDDDLEILHFEIDNPMPPYVLKLLKKKEAFLICWKSGEFEERPITKILVEMTQLLAEDQPIPDDENVRKPALLKHQSIILSEDELKELGMMDLMTDDMINSEITEEEEYDADAECDDVVENKTNVVGSDHEACSQEPSSNDDMKTEANEPDDTDNGLENNGNNDEGGNNKTDNHEDVLDEVSKTEGETNESDENEASKHEATENEPNENVVENEAETLNEETIQKVEKPNVVEKLKKIIRPISGQKFKIPGMWTPNNPRANAAFVYIYFRNLTESFLPPDPIPVPPHVAVGFDAYKRKEIMDIIEQHADAILAYGYFTSDDIPNATLIANSTFKYNLETPTINDKLIIKVAKKIGNALANLIDLTPCYVSQNSEIGYEECLLLFPDGYKNASETGVEPKEPEEEVEVTKKKRKKNKKNKDEKGDEEKGEASAEDGIDDDGDDDDDDDENQCDEDDSGEKDDSGEVEESTAQPELS